jgi:N-acetylglutamate synthase-like GNAT family acetyltransferase
MNVKFAQTKQDVERIIDLRYKILREPWQQPKETSTDGMEDKCFNALIEDANGTVIACGRLQENENKIGQIRYMAVDSNQQGKGLGKHILIALEKKGKEIGLTTIELQARENAVAFYETNNYLLKEKSFKLWDIIQHYLMYKLL